jgi:uncharacterized protein YbjT (DUF2867 family)
MGRHGNGAEHTPVTASDSATVGSDRRDAVAMGGGGADNAARLALVTGATGYIGGRLVPELLDAGYRVRVMVRDPRKVAARPWADRVDVAVADALDATATGQALEGVDVSYYLLHALGTGPDFADRELAAASNFGQQARTRDVGRVVYLGGLHPGGEDLSPHLRSRRAVGRALLDSGVPTAVLQAGVIIGSGSASFEMLRYLTERLPWMVTPKWVDTATQPIAVRDVLRYLVLAASLPADVSRTFDIGGEEVMTYRAMMQRYAEVAGLPQRRIVRVPVLSVSLSSHWVGLVTPVPASIARPLVDSLVHEAVVKERGLDAFLPPEAPRPLSFDRAVALALAKVQDMDVATAWTSASSPGAPSNPYPGDPTWSGGSLYEDERSTVVAADARTTWRVVEGLGGRNGWYSWPLGWWVRGALDRLAGGPGLRRGRLHPQRLATGDAVDWWRVEDVQPGRSLRLRAEMRLPGLAWLELTVEPDGSGRSVLRQRAVFHPRGLAGHLYWAAISPFHRIVFGGMQQNMARAAEHLQQQSQQPDENSRERPWQPST